MLHRSLFKVLLGFPIIGLPGQAAVKFVHYLVVNLDTPYRGLDHSSMQDTREHQKQNTIRGIMRYPHHLATCGVLFVLQNFGWQISPT